MTALNPSPLLDVSQANPDATSAFDALAENDVTLRVGATVGTLTIRRLDPQCVEVRATGDLGMARALVGLVPILWCAAAWARCVRENLLPERFSNCLMLSAIALISGLMLLHSSPKLWRFDGRRRCLFRRTGPIPLPLFWRKNWASRFSGARVEAIAPSRAAGAQLTLTLTDRIGRPAIEVGRWNRADIDRAAAEALAQAINRAMSWT